MPDRLLDLLDEMTIEPDQVNLIFIFDACAQLADDRAKFIGKKLFNLKLQQIRHNIIALNTTIHMFMSFGDVKTAEDIFEMIENKDIVSYGAMMKGESFIQFTFKIFSFIFVCKLN